MAGSSSIRLPGRSSRWRSASPEDSLFELDQIVVARNGGERSLTTAR